MDTQQWVSRVRLGLRALLLRRRVERALDDELAFHLEMAARHAADRGASPDAARDAAHRRIGSVALSKDQCRDASGLAWLDALRQDVRHAARGLRRTPGYTIVAMLALGLGIGGTAALLAAVDVVLLKPPPLPQVERLRWLEELRNGDESSGTPQRLRDWAQLPVVASAAGLYSDSPVVRGLETPERFDAMRMFGPLIETLGLNPVVGRLPTDDETRGVGAAVVLLSHRFWMQRMDGRSTAIGSLLVLDRTPHTVIGVLPPAAERVFDVELWAPAPAALQGEARSAGFLAQVVRLADDVSDGPAQAALDVMAARLAATHPDTDRGRGARLRLFGGPDRAVARLPLLVLLAAASLVLLVATLNVAALALARGVGRLREVGLRVSLGAGRARLLQLHFVESALLTAGGVTLGLLIAPLGLDVLKAWISAPRLMHAAIDSRLVMAVAGIAALCTLAVGALPAVLALRCVNSPVLGSGGSPASSGLVRSRWRGTIVAAEVALAVVVLVGAGLLTHSLVAMARLPLGFEPDRTLSFKVPLSFSDPSVAARRVQLAADILDRARTWPGVHAVGIADRLPLGGDSQTTPVVVSGTTLPVDLAAAAVEWRTATAGYFAAAGVPRRGGGLFPETWREGMPRVALVNETFVRRYLGGTDPIGREVAANRGAEAGKSPRWFRIIGVVGDVRSRVTTLAPQPQVYVPWGATVWPLLHVVVRTTATPEALIPAVRALGASIPDTTIEEVQTLDAHLDTLSRGRRVGARLVGGFATIALALAALGLYGLLAGEVTARRRELGVRLTLGARPAQLLAATWLRGVRLASVGLVLGLLAAPLVARAMSGLLIGVSSDDWVAPAASAAVLLATAMVASLVPALRAARVDPAAALRHD